MEIILIEASKFLIFFFPFGALSLALSRGRSARAEFSCIWARQDALNTFVILFQIFLSLYSAACGQHKGSSTVDG